MSHDITTSTSVTSTIPQVAWLTHILSEHTLKWLSTSTAVSLLAVSRAARVGVASFAWHDPSTRIVDVAAWRAYFPCATCLNASNNDTITDHDVVHAKHVSTVYLDACKCITDGALVHLADAHTVSLAGCKRVTGVGFRYLTNVHTLCIDGCTAVRDDTFRHLVSLHTLHAHGCKQLTDVALQNLGHVVRADVSNCWHLTNDGIACMACVRELNVMGCWRVSDAVFEHIPQVEVLAISGNEFQSEALPTLTHLHTLLTSFCFGITCGGARAAGLNSVVWLGPYQYEFTRNST